MKRIFTIAASALVAFAAVLVASCNVNEKTENPSKEYLTQFMSGDVLVTVTAGSPFATKSEADRTYFTVKGELNDVFYTLYMESEKSEDDLLINKIYSMDGTWLFSEIYLDDVCVGTEFAELEEDPDGIVSKAARQVNESYGDCVRRVQKTIKKNAETNAEVTCDFLSCGAVAAVVGIVDCLSYEVKE